MFGGEPLGEGSNALAQLAVLGAALSYAFAGVFGRRFRRLGVNPMLTAAGQVTMSSLVLAPIAFAVEGAFDPSTLGTHAWASIVGLAVLSTAAAYVLYFKILEAAGATNLLLVTLLIPVSAIVLGSLVLGERLAAEHFIGMALIALGLLCVALGLVGVVLPVMPSTVFFLIALWAFSKSSARFHAWLYHHPRLGRPLRQWHAHRVIPLPAKIMAVSTMALSLLIVSLFVAEDWMLPSALGLILATVAAYILTRPHRLPSVLDADL